MGDSKRKREKQEKTWKEVKALTQSRVRWRCFVKALFSEEE
jgi:hypothetical protein